MPWDPAQYEQFAKERYLPFEDLIALIEPRPGLRVIDLGCGTGELTRRLAEHLPESDVLGVDSSAEMLERASQLARNGLRFERGSVEEASGRYDVVFSHAALHWVPDHPTLVPRLYALAAPGGRIAVQQPSNFDHPTHTIIDQIADVEPYRAALGGLARWSVERPVLRAEAYAQLLYDAGARDITAFEKVYPHVLPDADGMVEWMSGTALVPFRQALNDELYASFLEAYRAKLRERFPGSPVLFTFKRTFFAATKPS